MHMPLLKAISDKYFQIWAAFVMTFLNEFPFMKHLPYLISKSCTHFPKFFHIWEKLGNTKKIIIKLQ